MSVPMVELCLDQRQKDREAAASFEKQIGSDTKGMFVAVFNSKTKLQTYSCPCGSFIAPYLLGVNVAFFIFDQILH